MDIATFKRAEKAAHDFIATHGADHAPYNTLLTLCYIDEKLSQVATSSARAVAVHINDNAPALPVSADNGASVPQWFIDGVAQCAGHKVTSGAILAKLGRPHDLASARQAGVWLRQMFGEPYRSNGRTVFAVPPNNLQKNTAPPIDDDIENPFHPQIPIASRVDAFMSRNQGKFTAQEIASAIGSSGSNDELSEIWRKLVTLKVPMEGSQTFLIGIR